VRHGFGPERKIQTGIGALDVQRPKVRDRMASCDGAEKMSISIRTPKPWFMRAARVRTLHRPGFIEDP